MKTLVNMCVSGMLALVVTSGGVLAQSATSAEARLKEKNIALPPVPPPVANYVDSMQVGKLLFLAGNPAGAEWKFKGKVGTATDIGRGGCYFAKSCIASSARMPPVILIGAKGALAAISALEIMI